MGWAESASRKHDLQLAADLSHLWNGPRLDGRWGWWWTEGCVGGAGGHEWVRPGYPGDNGDNGYQGNGWGEHWSQLQTDRQHKTTQTSSDYITLIHTTDILLQWWYVMRYLQDLKRKNYKSVQTCLSKCCGFTISDFHFDQPNRLSVKTRGQRHVAQ